MNKVASTTVAAVIGAGLVFGLTGCSDTPPKDFKKACDAAGGKTERDHDSLGMAPMAFDIGSRPKPAPKPKSVTKPKVKPPKTNKGWKLADGSHGSKKTSKPKKHKTDDNEWVCMKNGVELFDEE